MDTISEKMSPKRPSPKINNFTKFSLSLANNQYKYLIYFEAFLGINRLYLLNVPKTVTYLSRVYSALIIVIVIYFINMKENSNTASYFVFKYTATGELILLIGNSIALFQSRGYNFCQKLSEVDESLNISEEMALSDTSLKTNFVWVVLNFAYNVLELIIFKLYLDDFMSPTTIVLYIPILAHESEHILICSMLRSVYLRVQVVKAHVDKVLSVEDPTAIVKDNKGEVLGLVNNAFLDVSSLHRVYENLHHSAGNLNMILNAPAIIMLISSGVSTTFMLKSFINLAQSDDPKTSKMPVFYFGVRCIKYTLLVFSPCIYGTLTSGYVKAIRTAIYDAINNTQLGRVDRRKLKAFLQLTRDSNFVYAVFGVIAIDMSLPLSYFSICTTYLVIIIQFSKFIDE